MVDNTVKCLISKRRLVNMVYVISKDGKVRWLLKGGNGTFTSLL